MRRTFIFMTFLAGGLLAGCSAGVDNMETSPESLEANHRAIMEAMEISSKANRAVAETEVATAAPQRPGPGANVPSTVTLPPAAIQPITVD